MTVAARSTFRVGLALHCVSPSRARGDACVDEHSGGNAEELVRNERVHPPRPPRTWDTSTPQLTPQPDLVHRYSRPSRLAGVCVREYSVLLRFWAPFRPTVSALAGEGQSGPAHLAESAGRSISPAARRKICAAFAWCALRGYYGRVVILDHPRSPG